jgi:hypothetical protein
MKYAIWLILLMVVAFALTVTSHVSAALRDMGRETDPTTQTSTVQN